MRVERWRWGGGEDGLVCEEALSVCLLLYLFVVHNQTCLSASNRISVSEGVHLHADVSFFDWASLFVTTVLIVHFIGFLFSEKQSCFASPW